MEHKLGVIGYGGMASGHHCGVADRLENLSVGGVYDLREERLEEARKRGYKTFDKLEDFLASGEFDIVLVATPNNFHCPLARKALRAGYHVISEKPVAIYPKDLEETIAVSKECGKIFTVHQNRRWDYDFLVVKEAIERGLVGKPYMIESRIHGEGGGMYGWRSYEVNGGGMFRDWGVHMLDQLLYLIQEPVVAVSARIANIHTAESDDYTNLLLRFKSGLAAQMEVATYTLQKLPRWAVYGDEGALIMQEMDGKAHIRHAINRDWQKLELPTYLDDETIEFRSCYRKKEDYEEYDFSEAKPNRGWDSFYLNLLDTIDGKAELAVKPEEALRVLKVIETAYRYNSTIQCII